MISDNNTDILARIEAMRAREDSTKKSFNYFEKYNACNRLNELSRKAMATWITQVQQTLSLDAETVWIAMSYLDRYLGSDRGDSREVLRSKCKFQLAAITSFYTAVKIHEPVVLGLDMLVQICRGTYSESDITSMENDILSALDWRVSCHTPMNFAMPLLELVPEDELSAGESLSLLEECQRNVSRTVTDIHFSCLPPSAVGISCLAVSLENCRVLSHSEKRAVWIRLSKSGHFNLSSRGVVKSQQRLMSHASPSKPNVASKLDSVSQSGAAVSAYGVDCGSLSASPICVTQTARQA